MDSRNYYSLAHSTLEIIKEQPKSLIGGTLKEYQVRLIESIIINSLGRKESLIEDEAKYLVILFSSIDVYLRFLLCFVS